MTRKGSRTVTARRRSGRGRDRVARHFIPPPNQACWIESDSYDRTAFARLAEESPSLRQVMDDGAALVPRFGALVEDLFCLCFKHNVVFHGAAAIAPSAHPNRPLLAKLAASPAVDALRQHSVLEEANAGLGAVLLAEEILAQIRKERLWTRDDLRDLWDVEAQESEVREAIERYEVATELGKPPAPDATDATSADGDADRGASRTADAAARARAVAADFEREADVAEARLRQKSRRATERAEHVAREGVRRAALRAITTAEELAARPEDHATWGLGLGAVERHSAGAQLELGKRLLTNPKLKRLAQMVGRMRAAALRLRKRTFERASEETYAVHRGNELSRLLPHELVTLRHPLRRRDFQRRVLDGALELYELRAREDKGRGPLVVCLDGSSSMAGEKEIWAKAVALTLLDIARRQRRLFRALCFAGPEQALWTQDFNPRTRWEVDEGRVYDLAEYFPGGGTDFQTPLTAALDCLQTSRFRRGDIVLITDGEARVSPEWLAEFRAEKERLGFFVFSVLIDVGTSTLETVGEFSDRITTVRQLTDEAAEDLFVGV